MQTINATELARRTRQILDAVANRGETVVVERHCATIVRIMPPERTMTAAEALAGLQPMLTPVQAKDWLKESREPFGDAVLDPWV